MTPADDLWVTVPAGKRVDRASALAVLLKDFAATAAARDQAGGTAKRERDLIRQSGLLAVGIPRELGGAGGDLSEALSITRRIAAVDSALAHLYAFHHLMLASLQFYGPRSQWAPLLQETAAKDWFWGNALNPLDKTTGIAPAAAPGEYRIDGVKSFCSGASDSDRLIVSALPPGGSKLVIAAIPTARDGIEIHGDWDNFGQRQTDSGRVSFHGVQVFEHELLTTPGPLGSPFASLRSNLAQLILTNLYLGIAEGALAEAAAYVKANGKPWLTSTAATVEEDPYLLRNFGDYHVEVAGAAALTDLAQHRFQAAFDLGDGVDEAIRGEAAIAVSTAKVAASRAAVNVSSRVFEVMGARATTARLRLDRYWRNARTHTLHDPLDYKLQELGTFALTGRAPTPSFYA